MAAPAGQWWDSVWERRKKLTVSAAADNAVPTGYSVKFSCVGDDAADIYNDSLSNGNDFRIVYWNGSAWIELDRDRISFSAAAIEVWFKLQAGISGGSSDDNYYAHYDNSGAGSPPANKANVYKIWDDFEDGNTDGWSVVVGTSFTATTGQGYSGTYCGMLMGPNGQNNLAYLNTPIGSDGYIFEAWVKAPYRHGIVWANADTNVNWWLRVWPNTIFDLIVNGTLYTLSGQSCAGNTWHKIRINRIPGGNVQGYLMDVLKHNQAQTGTPSQYIGLQAERSTAGTAYGYIDEVKVRLLVATEPTIVGGEEEEPTAATQPYSFIM